MPVAPGLIANADATNATDGTGIPEVAQALFNGGTFDRRRGNVDTPLLTAASGATVSQNSSDQTNYNGRGVKILINMTAAGTGSVTFTIQGKDVATGLYYTILASAAVTANGVTVLTVYPGIAVTANVAASDALPRTWRILVTANNANPTSYTVSGAIIV